MKSEVRVQEAIAILIDNVACCNIPKMTKSALRRRKKEISWCEITLFTFFFLNNFNDFQSIVVTKTPDAPLFHFFFFWQKASVNIKHSAKPQ